LCCLAAAWQVRLRPSYCCNKWCCQTLSLGCCGAHCVIKMAVHQKMHVTVKELWAVPACKPVHDKPQQQKYLLVLKTLVPCGWLHTVGSSKCLVWAHSSPQRTSGGTDRCTRRTPASAPGWRQNGTPRRLLQRPRSCSLWRKQHSNKVSDVTTVYDAAAGLGHAGTGVNRPRRATLTLAKAVPLCHTHTCRHNFYVA
jgi:hypothetical protein